MARAVFLGVLSAAAFLAGCEAHVDVLGAAKSDQGPRDAGTGGAPPLPDAIPPPQPEAAPPLPDAIPPQTNVVFTDLGSGNNDTCGVAGSALYCWGRTASGRMRLVPERVGTAEVWRRVSNGRGAHCAERTTGSVYCFGLNDEGQLGQGDTTTRETPAFVNLAARMVQGRAKSFCAVLETGELHCWGANEEGQLAQNDPFPGDGVDRLSPVQVETDTDWNAVDVGQGHGCGIRAGGDLYCWGRDDKGQCGLGDQSPGQTRYPQPVAAFPTGWTAVSTGQNNTCGIRAPGALFCFGIGEFGALGLGDRNNRLVPTQVGTLEDWIGIDVDTFHTCGIRAPGTLWCWGRNDEGQLGTGDLTVRDVPTRVDDRTDWVQVTTGQFHTCARRRDGSVWCAGENEDGRLGTGDVDRRNVFTRIEPLPER
jgi:alpha-tubulin suppressor-like RCC1 family protein